LIISQYVSWPQSGEGKNMIFYCVVQEYYDDGTVHAWITNHAGSSLPENKMTEYSDKDVYQEYFSDKGKAIEICDQAKKA